MATRIRRLSRGAKQDLTAHENEAKELLKSIANTEEKLAKLQATLQADLDLLEQTMKAGKLSQVSEGKATAAFVQSAGKAQNVIDPKKFFNKVDEADFFASVSVSVTKAKAVLSQKELDRITTKIPATPGEAKLKITYAK